MTGIDADQARWSEQGPGEQLSIVQHGLHCVGFPKLSRKVGRSACLNQLMLNCSGDGHSEAL